MEYGKSRDGVVNQMAQAEMVDKAKSWAKRQAERLDCSVAEVLRMTYLGYTAEEIEASSHLHTEPNDGLNGFRENIARNEVLPVLDTRKGKMVIPRNWHKKARHPTFTSDGSGPNSSMKDAFERAKN